MLTGPALGAAIESARKMKGITKKALADHFKVKPPSIQDWVERGTIEKAKLPELWRFFADVVGFEHWGLDAESLATDTISIDQAVPAFVDALAALPPSRWVSVRAQLDQLAGRPEMRDDTIAELKHLLAPPASGKRQQDAA